jgi:tetratricopeptide (TPR) repeat protein
MKKSICRIFRSLITLAFCSSLALSAGNSLGARQQSQDKDPLSLSQIEALLQGRAQGEGALRTNRTLDTVIAGEIQERGVAFRVDENILERLRKLGAGIKTIQALRLKVRAEKPVDAAISSEKITILVADFKSLNEQNYGVTEILIQQLRDATKDYSDVEVEALNSPITAQQGSAAAVAKGKEHGASIVLWGWYTVTREKLLVDVHCPFIQKPKNLALLKEGQTLLLSIFQLESFDFQMRLAGEMTYLTLLTVGLARLEAEDYDGAIARFTAAINQPMVPESMVSPADVYYFRGVATFLKRFFAGTGEIDTGTPDLDKAIGMDPQKTRAHVFRGMVLALNEKYDQAISDFSQAIEREPNSALAYLL